MYMHVSSIIPHIDDWESMVAVMLGFLKLVRRGELRRVSVISPQPENKLIISCIYQREHELDLSVLVLDGEYVYLSMPRYGQNNGHEIYIYIHIKEHLDTPVYLFYAHLYIQSYIFAINFILVIDINKITTCFKSLNW